MSRLTKDQRDDLIVWTAAIVIGLLLGLLAGGWGGVFG